MSKCDPMVGEPIFNSNGEYVTDIGAIISHFPYKVFGRDGNKYLVTWTISNNQRSKIQIISETNYENVH